MKKQNLGITLVALVITIIILLILAGITISQLTGSGLFENAKLAKEKWQNGQEKEDESLAEYEKLIGEYISNSRQIGSMTTEELKQFVEAIIETKMESSTGGDTTPAGTVISYMGNNAPEGYLFCDGAEYNISEYSNLAEQIKSEFGSYNYYGGDGEHTFAVPNLQGEFLRGYSTGATASKTSGVSTTNVGIHQDGTNNLQIHKDVNNNFFMQGASAQSVGPQYVDKNIYSTTTGFTVTGANVSTWTGSGTTYYLARPTNTAVLYCIKY